jgi:multidrug efflux pump subunit AcrA (membrane-fusion protein)
MAEISLNEIDAAKVKVDQKATLTFDAIDDLTITGKVSDVDTVGTVSQGVVTYTVKIAFDTQDERVKSGMTVNASIITDVKTDALLIPNSAVKMNGEEYYVEVFSPALHTAEDANGTMSKIPPSQKTVTVGIANDSQTEILSGLSEGDQVVERTVTAASLAKAATTASSRSVFGGMGGGPGR